MQPCDETADAVYLCQVRQPVSRNQGTDTAGWLASLLCVGLCSNFSSIPCLDAHLLGVTERHTLNERKKSEELRELLGLEPVNLE